MLAIRPQFAGFENYRPTAAPSGSRPLVDLAQNESRYEPPAAVARAVAAAVRGANAYPDPTGLRLREAIAHRHGVRADEVVLAPAGAELITMAWRLMAGPGDAGVYAWPGFDMYRIAGAFTGAEHVAVPLVGGRHDVAALGAAALDPRARVVAVANPHNPTGTYLTAVELDALVAVVPDHVLVLNDEAYVDFVDAPDFPHLAAARSVEHGNLLTLRTFSKAFGLAGIRIAYGIACASVVALLSAVRTPFAVSAVAEAAALAALECTDEVAARAAETVAERGRLAEGLAQLHLRCLPSQANFVFVETQAPQALFEGLRAAGVLVRPCDDGVRITVGTPAENDIVLDALAQLSTTAAI